MSRVARLGVLLSVIAAPAAGQDRDVPRLRARADSVLYEWRQAQRLADLADSLERERARGGRDTLAVGTLRIIANPSPLPLHAAAARVWPLIDSLYGDAAEALVDRPYLIRAVDPDTAVRRGTLHVGMELPWDLDVAATATVLLVNLPMPPPDRTLEAWAGASLRPSVHPRRDRAGVYVQLVTAPSQAVRRCFLGDRGRCADVLGIAGAGDELRRWYGSAAERRAVVIGAFADYFTRGAHATTLTACVARDDTACRELLGAVPAGALPRPVAPNARVTLVHDALRLGGRGAYARLMADSTARIADRLAAAAGIPADSLIGVWHRGILAARPRTVAMSAWTFGAGLIWLAFFAACGLRSTRWRL